MVDHSKIGTSSAVRVAGFDSIDVLITDQPLSPEMAEILADSRVEVVVAI